ncbi:hypothetical protein U1Q18_042016, partial [Sarracenia purpurea var. burkii]
MIVGHWPSLHAPPQPTELCGKSRKWLYSSLRKEAYLTSSLPKPEFGPKFPIKCSCNEEERTAKSSEALSLLTIQTLELNSVLWLLNCIVKPQYKLSSFFQTKNHSKERNWLLASVLGFGFLLLLVFFTSVLADQLIGPKDVNNSIPKKILSSSSVSKTACILVYCVVTPLLEEIVYRGFLLKSLASEMKWSQAVVISSAVFSAAHFSGESFLQLFLIG